MIIIIAYAWIDQEEATDHIPSIIFPDEHNKI
ncbi:MAG: aspartate 1-decarboxylase [Bacteroidales bacterium]